MTDTTTTIQAWSDILNDSSTTGEILHLSPCEALAFAFPAIVNNAEIMNALVSLTDPAIEMVSPLVLMGAITHEDAEEALHNLFHLLQVAAALGHMVGVDESTGVSFSIPSDLSDVAWDNLPDFGGDS